MGIVTGEGQISQLAPSDALRRYAFHALHRIEDEVAKGVLPEKGTVAWY